MNLMRKKNKLIFIILISLSILLGHIVLTNYNYPFISLDGHWQLPCPSCIQETPFKALFYTHGASPFLGMIHILALEIGNGNPDSFYSIFLPVLHVLSFIFFLLAIERFRFKYTFLITSILFLNPLLFSYFRYPFYSTYLFTLSSFLLFSLFSNFSSNTRFFLLSVCLSVASFIRPSWHISVILLLILWGAWNLRKKIQRKILLAGIATFLLPFCLYIKNYFLFDSFSGSTWLGMNIARSYTRHWIPNHVTSVPAFSSLDKYKGLYNESDPLIQKYSSEPCLNGDDFQNVRYIIIAKNYKDAVVPKISTKRIIDVLNFGFQQFFHTPGDYFMLAPFFQRIPYPWNIYPNTDFFSLTISKYREISFYKVVYPLLVILLLLSFKNQPWRFKLLSSLLFFLIITNVLIDPFESNRMRIEIEPIWYFLILFYLFRFNRIFRNKINRIQEAFGKVFILFTYLFITRFW